ncbi:10326_t:CDS:2, partial [Dentiscutata heterogama]
PLSLDKDPLLLDDELFLDKSSIDSKPVSDEESLLLLEGSSNSTQNTITEMLKSSQQNIIVKRKSNTWINDDDNLKQCISTFEITTSTTNLASYLQTIYRLSKTSPLLPLSSKKETAQLRPVKLDPTQSTLLELVNFDDMQPFNVLVNEQFQDILYEAEPQFQFLDKDIVKQKLQKDPAKDKKRDIRNNAKALKKLLLDNDSQLEI